MKTVSRSMLLVASLLTAGGACAAGVNIGLVAPQNGNFISLGAQMTAGAGFEAQASRNTITPVNEPCSDGSGQAVADALIKAKVQIAIGFLCSETLEDALPSLKDAGIPVITVSVRSHILMEDASKNGWPLFRLAPADGDEAKKITGVILENWPADPIALVDDGTIHGRELIDAVRTGLDDNGMKPVFNDTLRPGQEQQISLVRRLKKAGATRVLIGGDRSDVAIIARDAAAEKITLQILGGDAMRAADQPVALADGVQAVTIPTYSDLPPAAAAAQALRTNNVEPEGYVLPTASAALIAGQAVEAALAAKTPVATKLSGTTWQTPIGPVAFGSNHELTENPYRLLEWRNHQFAAPQIPAN